MSNSRGFSSQSYTPSSSGPAKSVDTSDKHKEKKALVGLNDKFVKLIDKVKNLEDEKTRLEKELEILKEYEVYTGKVDDLAKQHKNDLKQRVENLLREQEKLKDERERNIKEKDDTKKRLEEEQKKKYDLENDCILAKKELDNSQLEHVQLMLDLDDLVDELEFLRNAFDEEIRELLSQIQNKHVVLPNNNKRSLDMGDVIQSTELQYANMAVQSREEAERWYKKKMDVMVNKTEQQEEGVRDIKRMISELLRQIHWLTGELESLTRKEVSLKKEIDDVQKETDVNVEEARKGIDQLKEALKQAKTDYAGLIRDYQEMLNLKLKLDMEIATYRKLLEGEEARYDGVKQGPRNANF
ncbi:keratin, type II cytoskeletal 8-like [Betta splendens]|uniref:Keratin, type II cytoskeletal 8 n=1 Tax=Betta splendens TaxID=158456 RepID=A0A6P7LCJ4_BETSP|nr:keratin, type II cytoskeletal 8-like [Betta splendens]XP_028991985.1 keratin, type II cytoskeletal 8-like [Betta splendens]